MQMYTGTRLTMVIHRRFLSRFFLREGGRLYTGYIFLCPFSLTSLGKSCMQKENLYHHHIIFMVCTCIDHSCQPISTQEITQLLYTVIYPTESVIQP